MIGWSLLAALLGVLGTWLGTARLARRESLLRPWAHWLLGMGALLPAWVVAFLSLLGRSSGPRPEKASSVSWILSSSAALLGVIVTDAVLRRLRESGRDHSPAIYWLLGVVALLPAWGIALLGLMVKPTVPP